MKHLYLLLVFTLMISCGKKQEPTPSKPTPTPPDAVTGVFASKIEPTAITLQWTPISGAVGYKVYRNSTSIIYYNSPYNIFEITGLISNATYGFQVSAVFTYGEGPKSTQINVKTANGPAPSLYDFVDDPKWVSFLTGKWGYYSSGEGYQYSHYLWTFEKDFPILNIRWTHNDYATLTDTKLENLIKALKIEKNILYLFKGGDVFEKYARLEKISDDEMNVYRIVETDNSYSESSAQLFTLINSVEKPQESVIESPELKKAIVGSWSYTDTLSTNTAFDFTGEKNFCFDNSEYNGSKRSYKYEFKINAANIISVRKWNDALNPAWARYKIVLESPTVMKWYKINPSGSPEAKTSYTLTKK